jgi:hypothetical protein
MFGDAARDLRRWIGALFERNFTERVDIESRLWYFLGYVWERQRERWQSIEFAAAPAIPPRAQVARAK